MRQKYAVADMRVSLMILLIGKEQAGKTSVKLQPGLLLYCSNQNPFCYHLLKRLIGQFLQNRKQQENIFYSHRADTTSTSVCKLI